MLQRNKLRLAVLLDESIFIIKLSFLYKSSKNKHSMPFMLKQVYLLSMDLIYLTHSSIAN
jgi:hypothetical protein